MTNVKNQEKIAEWIPEVADRLAKSKIYQQLMNALILEGDTVKAQVSNIVFEGVRDSYAKSKLIIKYMPEYTLHDSEHLFRVLYNMEKLIPEGHLKSLSVPDLMLLILSAFFHDLGMAPYEKEIRAWKRNWEDALPSQEESERYEIFSRFSQTYPDKLKEIDRLRLSGNFAKAEDVEYFLISEYIRTTHAQRAKSIIHSEWKGRVLYRDTDLTAFLAQICFSHNEDAMELLKMETSYLCGEDKELNPQFVALILRLADLLDFDAKRTPTVLFSHLAVRNPVSLQEWHKHRAIQAWKIKKDNIAFTAKCSHPAIEASIRKFCDYIDDELKSCSIILSKMPEMLNGIPNPYKIPLAVAVDTNNIKAETDLETGEPIYYYEDTSFELNKNQVIELLMGTKLYGDPQVALRELIQNSRDACQLSAALHEKWNVPYKPEITVRYYTENNEDFLEVNDNGIGMNKEIIDKYYSKVGSSFYKSRDFYELKAASQLDFIPVSEFGIGILSCFMVADTIEVETKRLKDHYDYDKPIKILIEGHDSIFTILKSDKRPPGTSTKLVLRERNPWEKMSDEEFIQSVKNVFPNPPFPITIQTNAENCVYSKEEFESLNAEDLKDFSWKGDENINEVSFAINEMGFNGNVLIGILEKDGTPVEIISKLSKDVEIGEETFELTMQMRMDTNEIERISQTIRIDDEGSIKSDRQVNTVAKSQSKISLHGITYAGTIFPNYFNSSKKTVLKWPVPILMILDIQGVNALDLNSARNEVIYNERWTEFEKNLSYLICKGLKANLPSDYWSVLFSILESRAKSEHFLNGLKKAADEKDPNRVLSNASKLGS